MKAIFKYSDIKTAVAKDGFTMSSGENWYGSDVENFLKFLKWHRPEYSPGFLLGGLCYQEELAAIMHSIDATFPLTPPLVLVSILVDGPATLTSGNTGQYTATATYDDDSTADISDAVTWNLVDDPVGTVATVDSTGLVTTTASGSFDISATLDTITSNTVAVTVDP